MNRPATAIKTVSEATTTKDTENRLFRYTKSEGKYEESVVALDEVPWDFLIYLAREPSEGDYKEARLTAGETAEQVLRNFSPTVKASGYRVISFLAARLETRREYAASVYYEAKRRGHFHEVGDIAFTAE